ncbi:MAG: chromate transporter [Lachnospiraceae bacterium]|nr:chromate transporter [Lachnospiraceae bacterium]
MKTYVTLFLTMLKTGLFTFGGGYAMIALLENEFVSQKKWIEKEEFLDMVAIAESTPGPIAINAATYIGYKMLRFRGALLATVGVCIPSFIIIYIISLFFDQFLSLTLVANAFKGIQVCVIYLIFSAGIKMLKGIPKTPFNIIIMTFVISAMIITSFLAVRFSTLYYILICGMCGVSMYLLKRLSKNKEDAA